MWKLTKQSCHVLYRAGYNLVYNDGIELAGYLTFLTVLSLFPFLVLIISVFGFIGQGAQGAQFIDFLIDHLPQEAVSALMPRIDEITSGPPQGLLTVAILGAIWTSSSAVEGMRTVLNRAYKVSEPPHFFFRRMLSIGQILVFTLALITVMAILVFAPIAIQAFMQTTGLLVPIAIEHLFVNYFVYIGAAILFAGIAGLYYVLPNVKQTFLGVAPGAMLVVILWMAGTSAITYYFTSIGQFNVIYGSLSSFIATLIFFFVMNIIFIYGAEFNHMLLEVLGKRIVEKEHSEISPDHSVIKNLHSD